jgi:hypothetical protein
LVAKTPSLLNIVLVVLVTSPLLLLGALAGIVYVCLDLGWCYGVTKAEDYLDVVIEELRRRKNAA